MSFYTSQAKSFKFQKMPDNKPNTKRAYAFGFIRAVATSPLSAAEKVAWMKYAAEAMPPGDEEGGVEPVAGPGPGFVPEGAPEEQQVQQLLEALPGNTAEEKLHAAVMALLEAQQAGGEAGGDAGAGGIEDSGGGIEGPGGQIDPQLLQQLLSQGGPAGGPPPMPPQLPPAGQPPGKPPVGGPQG